jgi:hypothetical protein
MCFDLTLAQFLGQLVREPFCQPPRVDEDQRGAMFVNQLDEPLVNFGPLLVHADGTEFCSRQLDREVERPRVADVENAAGGHPSVLGSVCGPGTNKKASGPLDRLLRR